MVRAPERWGAGFFCGQSDPSWRICERKAWPMPQAPQPTAVAATPAPKSLAQRLSARDALRVVDARSAGCQTPPWVAAARLPSDTSYGCGLRISELALSASNDLPHDATSANQPWAKGQDPGLYELLPGSAGGNHRLPHSAPFTPDADCTDVPRRSRRTLQPAHRAEGNAPSAWSAPADSANAGTRCGIPLPPIFCRRRDLRTISGIVGPRQPGPTTQVLPALIGPP